MIYINNSSVCIVLSVESRKEVWTHGRRWNDDSQYIINSKMFCTIEIITWIVFHIKISVKTMTREKRRKGMLLKYFKDYELLEKD